jgi:O-antigen/teichoic acid export membrane protein
MNSIETLIKKSGEYLDTKLELTKLKAINTSSDVLSNMVYLIVKILIIFLFVGFVSVALAILIGKTLGDYYYGFLIVGGFYLIVLLIIYVQRKKWIKGPVANSLINKMLK